MKKVIELYVEGQSLDSIFSMAERLNGFINDSGKGVESWYTDVRELTEDEEEYFEKEDTE